jgi:hypothetical protein
MAKTLKVVVLLELRNFFQSFPLHKLTYRSAVSDFEKVGFEIVIGKSKIKELFGVLLHLF